METENKKKSFIDLPEFVCLSYLSFIPQADDRSEIVTKVLCANGYDLNEIFAYAGEHGLFDPESEKYIGEKSGMRQYLFPGMDCRKAIGKFGPDLDLIWAMCSNCARCDLSYNLYGAFERNLIGNAYRTILENGKPEKILSVKMTSVLSILYEEQGKLRCYINKDYSGKVYSYLCSSKACFARDLKEDSAKVASVILGRDKTGYGALSEKNKLAVTSEAVRITERMLGRVCSKEDFEDSAAALSAKREIGIFTQKAFTRAYESNAFFDKGINTGIRWTEIGKKPEREAAVKKESGIVHSEPAGIEEHKRIIKERMLQENGEKGPGENPETEKAEKEAAGYQYTLYDYQKDFKTEETGGEKKESSSFSFDDNRGVIFPVCEKDLIHVPETKKDAGRFIESIHDSITVSIEAAEIEKREGLLFSSSQSGKAVFLRRENLTEEILKNLFDGKKYTLFTMNSVPVRKMALEFGISEPQKLISLSAMYHVCFDDEKIYPAGYFMKLLGSGNDVSARSFLTDLLPGYAKLDVSLYSEIISEGKEKESSRLNLYEEVLASAFLFSKISKSNCCPLKRTGYMKIEYELPAVIEKTQGGTVIRCFAENGNGAVFDFEFYTAAFVKIFRRSPFSSMKIRWSVLRISDNEICLWTHLKNTSGVEMIKEALAIAIADTSRMLKREPYEIYFETE